MKKNPISTLLAAVSVFGLSACEQQYGVALIKNRTQTAAPIASSTAVVVAPEPVEEELPPIPKLNVEPVRIPRDLTIPAAPTTLMTHARPLEIDPSLLKYKLVRETFPAASNQVKKLDFLFVIDNSASMADNQRKLSEGFQAFANTFYRRADLDICTMIITSDRYLGAEGSRGYQRERPIACTKPAGSASWTPAQMDAHIQALIRDFEEKVYVGTRGSNTELMGKSLVSFLYGMEQWNDHPDLSKKTAFFRKDAVANITFVTDENNYYFEGASTEEAYNDLPQVANVPIPGAKNGELDRRRGIKDYLDEYFHGVNPDRALSYSMTSIIELNLAPDAMPGIAVNLDQLPAAIGRESTKSDVSGTAQSYTDVYQSMADAIVLRATSFELGRAPERDLIVQLRHQNGDTLELRKDHDFAFEGEKKLILNPGAKSLLQAGDVIDVIYSYEINKATPVAAPKAPEQEKS